MEDLTDRRFGKLTAIKIIGKKHGQALWLCRCDCNNYTEVTESHLKTLHTKSCGCLKNKYNAKNKRLLAAWFNMKERCDKPNRRDSKYYHDKGVTYCDDWKEYKNFEKWSLENGYVDNLTLDRIDDSGNYEPSNCQWITLAEQQRKKEGNIWIEHNGERKILGDWAKEYGINRTTLMSRLEMGYTFEQALNKKPRINRASVVVNYNGEDMNITQLSEILNVSVAMISKRLRNGEPIEYVIECAKEVARKREERLKRKQG